MAVKQSPSTVTRVHIALRDDDPLLATVTRAMAHGETTTTSAVRRILKRHAQIMEFTSPPPEPILAAVFTIMREINYKVPDEYPDKSVLIETINSSTASDETKMFLAQAIMDMRYAVFAKMIEALKDMLHE